MANDAFSAYFGDKAPEEPKDDAYSSYFSEPDEQAPQEQNGVGQILGNVLNAPGAGLRSGVVNMIMEGGKGLSYGANKLGLMSDQNYQNVSNAVSDIHKMEQSRMAGQDPVSNALYTVGQIAPAAVAANPLSVGKGMIGLGVSGAAQGAAVNALNPTGGEEDLGDRSRQGAEWGGALGLGIGAGSKAGSKVADWVSGSIDPDAAKLAIKLKDSYGIDIPAYQLSSNPTIQKIGSILERVGLTGGNNSNQQAMSAIGRAIGYKGNATGLTEDVMSAARSENSKGYEKVLDNIGDIPVGDLDSKLANILDDAKSSLDANQLQPLRHLADKILNNVKDGDVIPAKIYKDMIKKDSILDRATQSPTIGNHAQDIEDALRDSMRAAASSEDAAALKKLDYQWKNMRTVQGLAAKSDASGSFPLNLLTNPVNKNFKDRAYSGAGALGDIAKGAKTFGLSPSSGTAENSLLLKLATGGGFADASLAFHNPMLAAKLAAGPIAGMTIGKGVGSALTSDWYKNMLLKSALGNSGSAFSSGGESLIPYGSIIGGELSNQTTPQ